MTRLLHTLALAAVVAWSVGPFAWMVDLSLRPYEELTRVPPWLPTDPTLVHYFSIFEGHPFARVIANSTVVAAATTALALALGSTAAFAIATLRVPGRGLILAAVLSMSMFPPIATVSPLYLVIRALGLRDTLLALILTYVSFSLPLTLFVLTHFFTAVPRELYLAARLDGCTAWQAFVRVLLPLVAPGLAAAGILVFILSWNEFLLALTLTSSPEARTVPVAIALFPGIHRVPWGEIAAATVVVTLPLVVLAFAFQRRIVAGLTSGAVKG